MTRAALALAFAFLAFVAIALAQAPAVDARPGGWIRDHYGVWRHVEGAYHVSYMRRGCRVEESWDGVNYAAQIRCAPGVKPG